MFLKPFNTKHFTPIKVSDGEEYRVIAGQKNRDGTITITLEKKEVMQDAK